MKECIRIMIMHINRIFFIGIGLRANCLFFVVTFLSLFFICGCGSQYKNYDIIVEYQVPFAQSNPRWNEVELIDEDDYGRKIFSYKSVGLYTNVFGDYVENKKNNAPVLLYVVVQKVNNRFIYCYDNSCYNYVSSFNNDNSVVIENLKTNNDWGKPLEESKMIALSIDACQDEIMRYLVSSVENEVVVLLEQKTGHKINDYYLDAIFLEDATPIFVLREVTNREMHEFGKSFVFYISEDGSESAYFELSDDIQNWNEEIHNFKASLKSE